MWSDPSDDWCTHEAVACETDPILTFLQSGPCCEILLLFGAHKHIRVEVSGVNMFTSHTELPPLISSLWTIHVWALTCLCWYAWRECAAPTQVALPQWVSTSFSSIHVKGNTYNSGRSFWSLVVFYNFYYRMKSSVLHLKTVELFRGKV